MGKTQTWIGLRAAVLAALIPAVFHALPLQAQTPSPAAVLAPGFAIVSGFSGIVSSPQPLPPGVNPADKIAINPDGVALRIIDTGRLGGPPDAQVVPAPKPLAIPASQIGQVFAIALDNAVPPNIYAAATSAYGLPIVVPDADGDGLPDRARRGAPNASFMPGLFGPVQAGGGPGSIWRIDGRNGEVSLFTNVLLDGAPNPGPALGGLAFDPASRQIYVADRSTGVIHSFNLNGIETGRFDHGAQALAVLGLPPIAFDPNRRAAIQSPEFDSADPATWGYAQPARRVFGLAVHRGRLYYAVAAGPRIWSVSLMPNGAFGADARVEVAVQPGAAPITEISKILFDDDGDMLLAERGAPTGAYDFGALRPHDTGRVLRLRAKPPGAGGTPFFWLPVGDYAIGFPPNFQNGDGGIALGYGYDPGGYFNIGSCGGTLWTTGSQLRISPNPALAQRLAAGGPLPIDGLQGNAISLLRPLNTPPLSSYFVDFDDVTERADTPGHMGDVVTWRRCPGPLYPMVVELFFEDIGCPIGHVRTRTQCMPTPCRQDEIYRGGQCEKPQCVPGRNVREEMCCPPGRPWNPQTRSCGPRDRGKPDLEIIKIIGRCGGPGPCSFSISITNRGDAPYSGPVLVGDFLNPGNISSMTGPAGWTCGQAPIPASIGPQLPPGSETWACVNPNATIAPGQSVNFGVTGTVTQTLRGGWQNCAVVVGDPAKETNWGNNKSCVNGNGDKPKPDEKPNLKIVKTAPASCTLVRDDGQQSIYRCEFTVTVTNDGAAPANNVTAIDTPSNGAIVGVQPDGSWNCTTANNSVTCQRPNALAPGASASFKVTLEATTANTVTSPSTIRGGGETIVANCAAIGAARPSSASGLSDGTGFNFPGTAPQSPTASGVVDGTGFNFPGAAPQSCARIRLPKNPKDPPGTDPVCVSTHVPGCVCSGPLVGAGHHLCRVGECQSCACPRPFVDGVCPPAPTTASCPADMVPTLRAGCCTPESIATGTCGIPPPLPLLPLPPPLTNACPFPLINVGGTCCSRESIAAGACGGWRPPPTVGCPQGQFRGDDGTCQTRPKPETAGCKQGQFRGDNGKCQDRPTSAKPRCGKGTSWDGAKCAKSTGTQQQCQQSFRWDGRRCVPAQKKPPKQAKPGLNRTINPKNTIKPPVQGGPKQPTGLNRRGR